MTSLDPKGLQAAFRWFANGPDQVPVHEMVSGIVTAYLSASTTPSGEVEVLEPVAWRSKVDLADEWDFTAIDPHCDTTDFAAVEPLISLSEASTALASMKREVERLDVECQASMATIADERRRAEAAEARIQVLEEALQPFADAVAVYDKFWATETGGQDHPEGEDMEMVTFFSLGSDVDMVPLKAFRSASQALGRE